MRYCNPMKSALTVFTLLLLASTAGAQPHPPMRSRAHRPLAAPPPKVPTRPSPAAPQTPSPFAAGPRTYAPRYDVPPVNQRRGEAVLFSAGAIGIAEFATPSDVTSTADESAQPRPTSRRPTV